MMEAALPRRMDPATRVVVCGAGFGGMRVAQDLQHDVDVTVVAPTDKFVFLPLIHEVASDHTKPTQVTRDLHELLPKARLVHGRAERVEGNDLVTAAGERLPFDVLVVAVGAEPNDFGVPGVREHALTFYSVGDALRANATVKMAAANVKGRPVRVTVAGASFTGVEVAGEIAQLLDDLGVAREVTLLDALPDIFPRQAPRFRQEVTARMRELDLRLRTEARIVEVGPDRVVYEHDKERREVGHDVVFWCAGIRPRRVEGVDPNVRPTLHSLSRGDVFVLGDAARFPREMGVPQLAQTAEDQASVVTWNVLNPDRMREYKPFLKGIILAMGHNYAVAEFAGGAVLAGRLPWHVKRRLYKAKIALA